LREFCVSSRAERINVAEADQRRAKVVEALQVRSPRLLGVYQSAVDALATPSVPDREAVRILLICHCMRELMNGLPTVMTDSVIQRPSPSSQALLQKLPALRAKHPGLDLELNQDLIPIPRTLALEIDALINAATQEAGRNRRNAAGLVTGGTDDTHPAIKQWQDAYGFFVGWAHLDRNYERERELPSDETLLDHIRVVEDVIVVRSTLFFDNLQAIEDLLAVANDVGEGDRE
jgi:hypothetical protein